MQKKLYYYITKSLKKENYLMSINVESVNTNGFRENNDKDLSTPKHKYKSIFLSSIKNDELKSIAEKCNLDNDKRLYGDEIEQFLAMCEKENLEYKPSLFKRVWNNTRGFFKNLFSKKEELEDSSVETSKVLKEYGAYSITTVTTKTGNNLSVKQVIDNTNGNPREEDSTIIETDNLKNYGDAEIVMDNNFDTKSRNNNIDYKKRQQSYNKEITHKANFTYNKEMLEDYIINEATDSKGNKLYFSDVKSIREILPEERTPEQIKLLNEFENFINYVLEAGNDYGVDPKQIIAIIQKEVGFDGSKKGKNGNGYMQITTITVADMLNNLSYKLRGTEKRGFYVEKTKYGKGLKQDLYGSDIIELFNSRGFKLTNNMTKAEKDVLLGEVVTYLRKNTDPEFNIRLGTIILRAKLLKNDGDFTEAARDYNGNGKIIKGSRVKDDYAKKVIDFYDAVSKDLPETTYEFS